MKKKLFIFASLLLFSFGYSQTAPNTTDAQGRKQGHWIKFDDQKKKIYEGDFINNNPTGKFTYFYDTGIPWAVTLFYANGTTGYTKTFNANGKISSEGKYLNEKKDSLWKFYDNDGKIISDELYANAKKNGECKVYYPSGAIAEEKNWKNGLSNGKWKKYFESGQLKYDGNCINDKVEGSVKFYFPTGKVFSEGVYKGDMKEGVWIFYNEDGTIKNKETYIKGRSTTPNKNFISNEETEKAKKKYENSEMNHPDKMNLDQPK